MPSPERLLLTGALVFDGLSDELHAWDVLIENGEIEEVGPDLDAVAERIDASGKVAPPSSLAVSPGIWLSPSGIRRV